MVQSERVKWKKQRFNKTIQLRSRSGSNALCNNIFKEQIFNLCWDRLNIKTQ